MTRRQDIVMASIIAVEAVTADAIAVFRHVPSWLHAAAWIMLVTAFANLTRALSRPAKDRNERDRHS